MKTLVRSALLGLAASAVAFSANAASTSFSTGYYTFTYDNGSAFGALSSPPVDALGSQQIGWTSPNLSVISASGPQSLNTNLFDFTITAKPGYTLSGLALSVGGTYVLYAAPGGAATTAATVTGTVGTNGGAGTPILQTLPYGVSGGQFAPNSSSGSWTLNSPLASGSYTSVSFSGGVLGLTATASPGSFANAQTYASAGPTLTFQVAAVPEPHEWAMMLAGLGLVGWVARRRQGGRAAATPMLAA